MNLPLLYGYRREKGRIVIDEREAEIVRFIFRSCLNGMGKGRITEALREQGVPCRLGGEWQTETVGGILKNEKYTGDALLLCRERLLCPDIPQETHDIRIPAVVTERGRLE